MHSHAIVKQQNRPDPRLKMRSYLLNRLSERSGSAVKRKEMKFFVRKAIF
jgi:hypothetical protein